MGSCDTGKPVQLIINPSSGYGGRRYRLKELRTAMRSEGIDMVEYVTKGLDDGTARAKQVADDARAVLVWGGDGTANAVAAGLAGTETPMIPYPAGTENLLAKELRIPSDPSKIIDIIQTGRHVHCDMGVINGRNFMLIIGIGFDGEVVRRLSEGRSGHISHLSYFWPIWRTFWEHNFPKMRIIADGKEIFHDYGLAFVGNISRYAVGLRICRNAVYDDGMLDLVVFSCKKQTALMLHAAWTLLRLHPLKGDVLYKQFKNVKIECDTPVQTQVDGDIGPDTPLDISVSDKRLRLIIPEQINHSRGLWPWKNNSD